VPPDDDTTQHIWQIRPGYYEPHLDAQPDDATGPSEGSGDADVLAELLKDTPL
jgi:hypothetical protein